MTSRVWFIGLTLGGLLPCLATCQDHSVEVPDRVWDAAMAWCEQWKSCSPEYFIENDLSIEDCAHTSTKYFPWDGYTEECIEAHIATFECEAGAPCYPEPYPCGHESQLRSYYCWRWDTAYYGWNCGMDATDFANCNEWCPRSSNIREYALCSAETPDYCLCGGETCQDGEYCCYCEPE